MERVMGIEPTPSAWKAEVLPLNYTRLDAGRAPDRTLSSILEPEPASLQCCGFSDSTHFPRGGGGRIRTFEGVSRQIYSLLPLTAWVPHREKRAAYSDFAFQECQFELARDLLASVAFWWLRGAPDRWTGRFSLDFVHWGDRKLPPLPWTKVGRKLDRPIAQPGQP